MDEATTTSCSKESPEKPSQTIVTLIADLKGTSPTDLTPPLYSAVDPEALDSLFHSSATNDTVTPGHVCFQYCGYEIRVESSDEITITNL